VLLYPRKDFITTRKKPHIIIRLTAQKSPLETAFLVAEVFYGVLCSLSTAAIVSNTTSATAIEVKIAL
jgi:hypothetical protein